MAGNTAEPIVAALGDGQLGGDIERIVAATGRILIRVASAADISRQAWTRSAAVLVDAADPDAQSVAAMPRRSRVVLVSREEPSEEVWRLGVTIGAEQVVVIPRREADLVALLSASGSGARSLRAPAVAVIGARGGAGASVFTAALALASPGSSLIVDCDPGGGGIDLILGWEDVDGLRWPDVKLRSGHVGYDALRRALPNRGAVTVLSSSRSGGVGGADAAGAVVDSARDAGTLVLADLPRRLTGAAEAVLDRADLVVVLTPAEVRACASAALTVAAVEQFNRNVGLVVRGPAPGGLRAADVAEMVGSPLIAAMRPEPNLAARLDRTGLRIMARSPLGRAARTVLGLVARPGAVAA